MDRDDRGIAVIIDSEYLSPAKIMKRFSFQGMLSYASGIIDSSLLSLHSLRTVSPRV